MYQKEVIFLENTFREAFGRFCSDSMVVSEKGEFDVVTNIDCAIETFFAEQLKRTFPDDRLHAEEFSSDLPLVGRTWILDPIDGTYNFSTGSCHFGLQAALWDAGELQVCAIYLPRLDEMYLAIRGEGAFCNGKRIRVSERSAGEAIVSFGDLPHARPADAALQQKMMEQAYPKIARMRMFGAASIDFAMLSSGKTEAVVLLTKNKWDIAPGLLLAKEAGALTFGLVGEDYTFSSRGIIACNRKELFDVLYHNERKTL